MKIWETINKELESGRSVVLMCVLQSSGSSPGRQGFKMVVCENGKFVGSIGGGVMEYKLVELAKTILKTDKVREPFKINQVHRKNEKDQSGMICSGDQVIAFYQLTPSDLETIKSVLEMIRKGGEGDGELILDEKGLRFEPGGGVGGKGVSRLDTRYFLEERTPNQWKYREQLSYKSKAYIIGAGHVGLALSRTLAQLGFNVRIFDDRENLNTMEQNKYAAITMVTSYTAVGKYIDEGEDSFVVILTFGYRSDKVVIEQLRGKKYRYLGVMGSEKKMKDLFTELKSEGFTDEELADIHSKVFKSYGKIQ